MLTLLSFLFPMFSSNFSSSKSSPIFLVLLFWWIFLIFFYLLQNFITNCFTFFFGQCLFMLSEAFRSTVFNFTLWALIFRRTKFTYFALLLLLLEAHQIIIKNNLQQPGNQKNICTFYYNNLNSMKLSNRGSNFFTKIIENYPLQTKGQTKEAENPQKDPMQPFSHMHDHRKERQIYERPTEEKLQNMRYFKELGNQRFKQKNYEEASYFYQKVIVYSDYTFPDEKQQIAELELLTQVANMNMAICFIKQDKWSQTSTYLRQAAKPGSQASSHPKTKQLCNSTLKKAYYWQCKAHIHKSQFEEAAKILQKLEQFGAQEAIEVKGQITELLKQVENASKKYNDNSKQLSKKMFT